VRQATGDQPLRLLFWQAPTILNPHLGRGPSDYAAARCCLEPLLSAGNDGHLTPILAADVPTAENGGLPDDRTVIYRLRPGVVWADGQPFSAHDVVFTFQFITQPESAATALLAYRLVESVVALDDLTVRLTFKAPTAGWYVPFVGAYGMILPRHAFQGYVGVAARSAPFNLRPFGTGPYMVNEFQPGDLVTYAPNPLYRSERQPAFSQIVLKGGGDPVTAARAVLQTGEFDFAPFLQLEADLFDDLAASSSTGSLLLAPGAGVELLRFNQADPNVEIDGERSHPSTRHPFLTDPRVREALVLALDRQLLGDRLLRQTADVTPNILTLPTSVVSEATRIEYDVDRANAILDAAGYARAADGIRQTPAGQRLHILFATTVSGQRQKMQAFIKSAWEKIGVETELRAVPPESYFATSENPEAASRFPSDAQMSSLIYTSPFPETHLRRFYAADPERDWAHKGNSWTGGNNLKWRDPIYNQVFDQALVERDPERSPALWKRLNDILVESHVVVPLADRKFVSAVGRGLVGPNPHAFDLETRNIGAWSR
jgi:peptide/nickel transport system substrate-binding protein